MSSTRPEPGATAPSRAGPPVNEVNEHQRTAVPPFAEIQLVAGPRGQSVSDTASAELTAVSAALAGVRRGDAVAVVGEGHLLRAVLRAACGRDLVDAPPADVVVAVVAYDVPVAVGLLRPGGRLVAVAADEGAAGRTASANGLQLRHVEPVLGRVAWSALLPVAG